MVQRGEKITKKALVFCCIVAWIQTDNSGCEQNFLLSENEISWGIVSGTPIPRIAHILVPRKIGITQNLRKGGR